MTPRQTLRALVDRIIPEGDGHPGAWEAGAAGFLPRMLAGEARADAPLIEAGLARLDTESAARHGGAAFADLDAARQDGIVAELLAGRPRAPWGEVAPDTFVLAVIRLCAQGYWGDPGNGGNRNAASWRMIGYRPVPGGAAPPEPAPATPPTTPWERVADRYDAVVVGSGAGGGVAACVLAEAGHRVLLVERGPWLTPEELIPDHLRNQRGVPRVGGAYDTPAGPPARGNPRVHAGPSGDEVVWPADPRWSNNAMTAGGGTRVYGAQSWRFCAEDFAMATTYGVPEDSSLADWPFGEADLAPDYDRAEWELGVSGDPAGNSCAGPRARGYPMPPVRPNGTARVLAAGARRLGLATSPVPLLINSVPRDGRGGCVGCATCVGFGCTGEFKNGTHNTVIPRAVATGRCDVLTGAQATRVLTGGPGGRVSGVALAAEAGGRVLRREVAARHVVLAAGAVETARLLLNSASDREPRGLGNAHDQVGRHLQGHVYAGAFGLFDEPVQDCVGPGPSIATNDFRHHNEGLVGGGMLANDFVPTPLQTFGTLTALGAVPAWGAAAKEGMRALYTRLALVTGPVQEIPRAGVRVTVDAGTRDRFGVPVARLAGNLHPEDARNAAFLSGRAAEWLTAAGATTVFPHGGPPAAGPSAGQHQAGTCRMGTDPAASVTDPFGTVWGHDNLHVADASLHVTNGGVNPVLTVLALAYRVSGHIGAA
ncbi:GMC family oxidoreductase [Streptomyces sp. MP131-18]|uniref:GMC family oxidoreductase n=1 Tax=Streptomyces sp. MP131-18 TaxID=1857892 RepID=UPI00097BC546|nr:GMC family oxidoreductase [Streptomyces sp. MP131-18]ONK09917.1 6'''-hydroxyparomomycin C oxidase [Streptomyces sp. MP131-18]